MSAPVGGHKHLDVPSRIETVKLVNQLQHGPLNLIVTTSTIVETSAADGINFVKEDNAGLLTTRHLEELPYHTGTLSHILLDELRTNDTDESSICTVGDSTSTEGLASSWGAEEKDTLGRVDTKVDETFWLKEDWFDVK